MATREEPYRYCHSCGARLIVEKYTWSYDCNTGKPNTAYYYKCPKRRWFELSHPKTEAESYVYGI